MVGAAGVVTGTATGTGAVAGAGIWSQADADADSMAGSGSGAVSGLTAKSVGSTETDVSAVSVLASARGASSASTDGFASAGVEAMVVMPAFAFSGS